MDSLQAASRKLSSFRQIWHKSMFTLAGCSDFSSFSPTFSLFYLNVFRQSMHSPLYHRLYPSELDSESLVLGMVEGRSHMHIRAICFPIDPRLLKKEKCAHLLVGRELSLEWSATVSSQISEARTYPSLSC